MSKRSRDKGIYFMVSDGEHKQIEDNMKRAGIISMRVYLLKMALTGYVINLDLTGVDALTESLRNTNNNLNQLAKRANATGSIYRSDIENLRQQYDKLWECVREIITLLSEIVAL